MRETFESTDAMLRKGVLAVLGKAAFGLGFSETRRFRAGIRRVVWCVQSCLVRAFVVSAAFRAASLLLFIHEPDAFYPNASGGP
jgi:hypothetical protein